MPHLVHYVNAIHGASTDIAVTQSSSTTEHWLDQDYQVSRTDTTYQFSDGAHIHCQIDQDDFPAELACAECWICYTVIQHPEGSPIQPSRIQFDNSCRESWWRTYHSA